MRAKWVWHRRESLTLRFCSRDAADTESCHEPDEDHVGGVAMLLAVAWPPVLCCAAAAKRAARAPRAVDSPSQRCVRAACFSPV